MLLIDKWITDLSIWKLIIITVWDNRHYLINLKVNVGSCWFSNPVLLNHFHLRLKEASISCSVIDSCMKHGSERKKKGVWILLDRASPPVNPSHRATALDKSESKWEWNSKSLKNTNVIDTNEMQTNYWVFIQSPEHSLWFWRTIAAISFSRLWHQIARTFHPHQPVNKILERILFQAERYMKAIRTAWFLSLEPCFQPVRLPRLFDR